MIPRLIPSALVQAGRATAALPFRSVRSSLGAVAAIALVSALNAQTTIPAGTTRYDADAPGLYILQNGSTRSVASGSNETIRIANTGTAGTYDLTINGTVAQNGSGRGIRTSTAPVTFKITIGTTGVVRAVGDDAIQGRGGPINVVNLGTLYSGPNPAVTPTAPIVSGRGLNVRDAASGTIVNGSITNSTALIRSDGGDAVRVGSNFSFTNYGTLLAAGVVNDASSNNVFNAAPNNSVAETYSAGAGFSFEDQDPPGPGATNSSLANYGVISGARHGVQAGEKGSNLTVTNYAGGQIIGRNGSGVGFDTTETDPSKIVVNNYGLIRGDYAGPGNVIDRTGKASPTNDGDGDGVDIDGAATIHNYATGQIVATGAGGYDSGGRANTSDGVSIGGGTIVNDGLIRGANNGILVNNDSRADRSGDIATTITNSATGTIDGQNGFAIRLENKYGDARDNDALVNYGTITASGGIPDPAGTVKIQDGTTDTHSAGTLDGVIYTGTGSARFVRGDGSAIQMGEGADTLTNYGTITGANGRAINMEGGNDTVNFMAGTIKGAINGGSGTNTLNLGNGVSHADGVLNFQNINVDAGRATLSGPVSGSAISKGGAGALVLSGANDFTGGLTVDAGKLVVNNLAGSATGLGLVLVKSGASLSGNGTIGGNLIVSGGLAPGNSIGTLHVQGDVTWNGTANNAWNFELGLGDLSDELSLGGSFFKGSGSDFVFDFLNGSNIGTYTLVDWGSLTTFGAEDFRYVNLASGLVGNFAIHGQELQFTTSFVPVPELSSTGWVGGFAAVAAGFVSLRRRKAVALTSR